MTTKYTLTATEKQLLNAGFRQVYTPAGAEPLPPAHPSKLGGVKKGQRVTPQRARVHRHPSPPPPTMTEAVLIRELRIRRIGRPATYAQIISTLLARRYAIRLEGGKLRSTPRGRAVHDFLLANFPALCAYEFTARMEATLDDLAQKRLSYVATIQRLWEALPKSSLSHKEVK